MNIFLIKNIKLLAKGENMVEYLLWRIKNTQKNNIILNLMIIKIKNNFMYIKIKNLKLF